MSEKKRISWGSWIGLGGLVVIIAAVAIPQYADYTHRSQASEAVSLMAGAKTPLAEYFAEQKKWPKSLKEVAGTTESKYTESVVIAHGAGGVGEIEVLATMRSNADRRVAGKSVRMVSTDGGRTWICSPGTMEAKNLPASCRPDAK